jgi:indolepyruvate ferredoxin oxidoreductase, alpha subunit
MKNNQEFIFGNQAVAQGVIEAGGGFATTFPGTPASEIGDSLYYYSKKNNNFYFEYSINEKVALETAAGAAMSGVKSFVSFKHYGLNVALDALLPLAYLEVPLVVAIADDPGSWSSVQAEQDSRWLAILGKIPTLEPSDPIEAKEMTKQAFEIAWEYKIPIIVRLTTRVSLSKSPVEKLEEPKNVKYKGKFKKPEDGFKLSSAQTVKLHKKILAKNETIKKDLSDQLNKIEAGNSELGVITTGVGHLYLKEALSRLGLDLPILKIGLSNSIDGEKIKYFAQNLEKILVVEELDSVIEDKVKQYLSDRVEINGKNLLPKAGEFGPDEVLSAISQLTGKKIAKNNNVSIETPKRIPFFCPGCPHRGSFYAIKEALGDKTIYGGDIGCYMLGSYQPNQLMDFVVSMGSSVGISHGISKSTDQKPVALIGDGTFFHAGLPAMVNLIYNHDDILLIILDNRFTAMTGQQPNPGTGLKEVQEVKGQVKIEEIAKASGADQVEVGNAFNPKKTTKIVKELYNKKGVSVLVIKGDCRMAEEAKEIIKKRPKYQLNKDDLNKKDKQELLKINCPAIEIGSEKSQINKEDCVGCALCQLVAPESIKREGDKNE